MVLVATEVFLDSFNCSTITDHGTGDHTVTYTNSMSNDDYAHPFHFGGTSGQGMVRTGGRGVNTGNIGIVGTNGHKHHTRRNCKWGCSIRRSCIMGTIKLDTITPLSTTTDITFVSNKFVGSASGNITILRGWFSTN